VLGDSGIITPLSVPLDPEVVTTTDLAVGQSYDALLPFNASSSMLCSSIIPCLQQTDDVFLTLNFTMPGTTLSPLNIFGTYSETLSDFATIAQLSWGQPDPVTATLSNGAMVEVFAHDQSFTGSSNGIISGNFTVTFTNLGDGTSVQSIPEPPGVFIMGLGFIGLLTGFKIRQTRARTDERGQLSSPSVALSG
jgi:hypothetical protein